MRTVSQRPILFQTDVAVFVAAAAAVIIIFSISELGEEDAQSFVLIQ